MKRVLFVLSASLILAACGTNLKNQSRRLELGMTKQQATSIMGKDHFIESISQTPEGKVEVLHFPSTYYPSYLLYFTNDSLSEFHRYIPPVQEVKVVKEEKK